MSEPLWYFAYGGNMSSRVLARRQVRPLSSQAARVRGWRLRFSQPGLFRLEPAFANLERDPDAETHGVLYRLSAADLARLDRVEGAEYAHEDLDCLARDGSRVVARAYVNPDPAPERPPSRRYLGCLVDGAREHGLPPEWIAALAAQPSLHVPVLSAAVTAGVGLFEKLRDRGFRPERLRMALRGLRGRR